MTITEMRPCSAIGPEAPTRVPIPASVRREGLRCNRPAGHDGDHMFSLPKAARLVTWPKVTEGLAK